MIGTPPFGHTSWVLDHKTLLDLIAAYSQAVHRFCRVGSSEGEYRAALNGLSTTYDAVLTCLIMTYAAPVTASAKEGANE